MQIEKESGRGDWRRVRSAGGEACGALGEIGAERLGGGVAQRDVALLLAFAAHEDGFVGPVNVVEIEADQLGVADAAAIEHFEDGLVARGPACGVVATESTTRFICSMEGTRGRCLGRRGVETSEAAFCSMWPMRASHLNQLRMAASARAAEALERPRS